MKLSIWVDSIETINQTGGNLNLYMLYHPNYTTTDGEGNPISANFISGEVATMDYYSYGSYECNATLSNQQGSFPAFWIMSGQECKTSFNNEIDIVELKHNHSRARTLDNNIFYYPQPCGNNPISPFPNGVLENEFNWGGSHTFKCIWTPSKIEFWVDNRKLNETLNGGQYWYPKLQQRVILSQQIVNFNNDAPGYGITTPQHSMFHWVKVKEFFLSPEITCTYDICSTGIATMDVDSMATNISWQLTPSSLFTTTSGTGKTANIVRSSGASGLGKITYTFQMPSGETFTAESDFWVGDPNYTFHVSRPDGYPVTNDEYGDLTFCPHTNYEFWIDPGLVHCYTGNEVWDIPSEWTVNYINGNRMSINTNDDPNKTVSVEAVNTCCGSTVNISYTFGNSTTCDLYLLTITPNPSAGEATLSIGSKTAQKVDALIEWDLEVYDSMQALKIKTQKIKGDKKIINTSGWKDGVYIVRAKVGDILLSEKLVVKH